MTINLIVMGFVLMGNVWTSAQQYATQIDDLADELKQVEPIFFNEDEASKLVLAKHLNLTSCGDEVYSLYSELEYAGSGKSAVVFRAVLAHDRPRSGLKRGDTIAVRITSGFSIPLNEHSFSLMGYDPLVRLSQFKRPVDPNRPITDYFPDFYGVYFGGDIRELQNFFLDERPCNFRFEEMEWVDTTFYRHLQADDKLSDSMIFEFLYGEWAGVYYMGMHVTDDFATNYGIKHVTHGRCYHIGDLDLIYYFNYYLMPTRIDLSSVIECSLPRTQRFFCSLFEVVKTKSKAGEHLLDDWNSKKADLFTLFDRYFNEHKKTAAWVEDNDPKAKHFYISQEAVDHEKSLSLSPTQSDICK